MSTTARLRPQSLDDLTGQDALKQKARIAIGASLARGEPLPHSLLTSRAGGLGKTTFAQILANECFAPLTATTGQCLATAADLRNLLIRLKPNTFLLVDEFHCIGRLAAEELLLVLEDGVLNVSVTGSAAPVRIEVPPFSLIAATTEPEAISPPLRQRFGLHFRFDFYTEIELTTIVASMASRLGMAFDESVCRSIAQRAMGIPRVALRLVERVRDVAQARGRIAATDSELQLAMEIEQVDGLGLHLEHREILKALVGAGARPISARNLALILGVGVETIIEVLEPPLVRGGLITIGAGGRRITEQGIRHSSGNDRRAQPC